jgi:AcrR family transcriptional regulator
MIRKLAPDKRQSFLDAALMLFVRDGVQNTSTAAIAKEAGTATGTLFLYFPTKQDLIDELILQVGREQSEHTKAQLSPSLSAREMFFTIWNASVHWFLEHLDAYQYVQQVRDTGLVSVRAVQESNAFFGYYYEAIQKGLGEGAIQRYPVEVIGGFLYQDIVATMNIVRAQANPKQQAKIIQMGFDIFWNGIRAESAG